MFFVLLLIYHSDQSVACISQMICQKICCEPVAVAAAGYRYQKPLNHSNNIHKLSQIIN